MNAGSTSRSTTAGERWSPSSRGRAVGVYIYGRREGETALADLSRRLKAAVLLDGAIVAIDARRSAFIAFDALRSARCSRVLPTWVICGRRFGPRRAPI